MQYLIAETHSLVWSRFCLQLAVAALLHAGMHAQNDGSLQVLIGVSTSCRSVCRLPLQLRRL